MAASPAVVNLSGLARRLIRDELISEDIARKAYEEAQRRREPFVQYLVEHKVLDSRSIALAASQEFGVPLLDLSALDLSHLPVSLVDEKLITKHRALPIYKRGNRLFLAISDPTNDQALDEIRFNTGLATDAILVDEDKLAAALLKALEATNATGGAATDVTDAELENIDVSGDEETRNDDETNIDDKPVVRYVNKILVDAITKGASDIHFEPYEKSFRIRFRQDGLLSEVANPPLNIASRLVSRLKVMSRMNIAERRIPQDGRIKLKLSRSRDIDFRVNTLPTLYGEKVVLRILDSTAATVGIDNLGMDPKQKTDFMQCISKPYGMVLVTGPTGSGKTVTLYSALNILNKVDINISTVEDPVEIQVAGINQVNLNPKSGLTFAAALRAFLRQDPDIIMVGEIRDLETAEIAVKAAQTGHLVLSTLHTNDAPQSLTRLANMGVPPFNIASSVLLILAQRLARKLCIHCKQIDQIPREALLEEGFTPEEVDAGVTIYKPIGCEHCNNGYKGRIGIFQVVRVSEAMGRLIMEGGNSLDLAKQARQEGYADLRLSGLRKVKAGITSLQELNRVTKD
ncbi:type IV-A pilus assembly ATPase PilB [Rhodoferax sp. 4810]|uniref:Type IV-A pilus assembly ATPase PilB n=1 Tax=Thiospirillum jenense TaxID=1653858 RepID=A0A839HFF1_9GAMM|nr:type IV-A pilus assembly ATPase PilB [Thiospirillum jenense]MBB1075432.1 type IV-A pilus assembly ATPase PilB [Rhodoferax jenense]MBB1126810.1 type IV-A pilus assembly ATPase PilB [Thiospirillum jenense]